MVNRREREQKEEKRREKRQERREEKKRREEEKKKRTKERKGKVSHHLHKGNRRNLHFLEVGRAAEKIISRAQRQ